MNVHILIETWHHLSPEQKIEFIKECEFISAKKGDKLAEPKKNKKKEQEFAFILLHG